MLLEDHTKLYQLLEWKSFKWQNYFLQHPISRFLSRYLYPSPQQEYEKYLHYIMEEKERMMLRGIENDIKRKMGSRKDYQSYYYKPAMGKYHRISKEQVEYLESIGGD